MSNGFLLQIYNEWKILRRFSCSLQPVGFRATSMSVLDFLSQKICAVEFSRPEVVCSRAVKEKVVFKMSVKPQ